MVEVDLLVGEVDLDGGLADEEYGVLKSAQERDILTVTCNYITQCDDAIPERGAYGPRGPYQ